MTVIHDDINAFNDSKVTHYYWDIDPKWVSSIFEGINERRVCILYLYPCTQYVKYIRF